VVLQVVSMRFWPVVPSYIQRWSSSEYTTSALPSPLKSNTALPVTADEQSCVVSNQSSTSALGTAGSSSFEPSNTM